MLRAEIEAKTLAKAVTEAKGDAAAELIDHLKKSDMAEQAERLLADTGWLPGPLRTSGVDPMAATDATEAPETDVSAADLPEFLSAAE